MKYLTLFFLMFLFSCHAQKNEQKLNTKGLCFYTISKSNNNGKLIYLKEFPKLGYVDKKPNLIFTQLKQGYCMVVPITYHLNGKEIKKNVTRIILDFLPEAKNKLNPFLNANAGKRFFITLNGTIIAAPLLLIDKSRKENNFSLSTTIKIDVKKVNEQLNAMKKRLVPVKTQNLLSYPKSPSTLPKRV